MGQNNTPSFSVADYTKIFGVQENGDNWYEKVGYEDSVDIVKDNMVDAAKSFISIGYFLKHIREEKLYLKGGYKSFKDCALGEFGLNETAASRYISFNKAYSINGNSPEVDEKYKRFSKSQLQEMLSLPENLREEISSEQTVQEIREIVKAEKQKTEIEEQLPGQTSIENDFPEFMPDKVIDGEFREIEEPEKLATSQELELIKPDDKQREYLNAFARHFISREHDWLIKDYSNRVLDVNKSPIEIKSYLDKKHLTRTWDFADMENKWLIINLFDDYIQLKDSAGSLIGNFDWFYLAAAIQSMWTVVAMEQIKAEAEEKEKVATSQEPEEIISIDPEEPEQQELPVLKNNDQRKKWLTKYKDWGLWYHDEHIDVNYYKYDFPDGSRLVVTEYPQRHSYWSDESKDEHYYHLLEKNKMGYKKPYDEKYRHKEDCETYLVDFLKNLQKKE